MLRQNKKWDQKKNKKRLMDDFVFRPASKSLKTEQGESASSSIKIESDESASNASPSLRNVQNIKDAFQKAKEKKYGWEKNDPRSIRLTRFICEFIALGTHSFSIVDEQGFIRLMKEARPEYPLPGRKYFTRKIKEDMYTDVRTAVQKITNDAKFIVFTTDLWTSKSPKNTFISFTAHCITSEYEQNCVILASKYFPESHTGENIQKMIMEMLQSYEIPIEKVHTIVTDNAKNMTNGVAGCGIPHQPCILHTLQLVLNKSIFEQVSVAKIITILKKITGHFNYSQPASKQLIEIQEELNLPLHLMIQHTVIRWNSIFKALDRAHEQKDAVIEYCYRNPTKVPCLTPEQWDTIANLKPILKIFDTVTNK